MLFLSLAVSFAHEAACGDASNAYFRANPLPPELQVLARAPAGFGVYLNRRFDDAPLFRACNIFFRTMGPVYGHLVAGRWWYDTFVPFITGALDFLETDLHPRFFFRPEIDAPPTLLIVIADDTPLTGTIRHVASVREKLSARFDMKWQAPITHIVGVDIRVDATSIRLSQERALNVVLESPRICQRHRHPAHAASYKTKPRPRRTRRRH